MVGLDEKRRIALRRCVKRDRLLAQMIKPDIGPVGAARHENIDGRGHLGVCRQRRFAARIGRKERGEPLRAYLGQSYLNTQVVGPASSAKHQAVPGDRSPVEIEGRPGNRRGPSQSDQADELQHRPGDGLAAWPRDHGAPPGRPWLGRASTQGKIGLVSIVENEAIAFIIAPDYSTQCDPVIASKASRLRGPAPDPVKQFTSRR